MKLYVLIPFLFTSIIVFSQHERKETLTLFDSIMAIEPYEQLYSKINTLQLQNEQQRDEFTRLNDDYTKLKEYLFRQDLYKKVFDQLELGIIPDSLELQNYFRPIDNNFWIYGDWTLFDIPKPDSKSPIIIFIDPEIDADLRSSPGFKRYPFNDFGLSFYNGDTILEKRYPKVAALIKKGEIVFNVRSFAPSVIAYMQSPKLQFPSQLFINSNRSLKSRKIVAANLLSFISDQANFMIKNYDKKDNVVPSYLKLENEKLASASIDEKIDMRIKFVEFLKIKYAELWE
jgi:hypothetical protein